MVTFWTYAGESGTTLSVKLRYSCADPESFVLSGGGGGGGVREVQKVLSGGGGSIFYEGREDLNTTISGPSSARQRNAI